MICTPIQTLRPFDTSFDNLDREEFEEDFLSFHKDLDDLDARSLVDIFHIGRSKWDISYFYFEGNPNYDIDSKNEDEIDELGPYAQSNLGSLVREIDDINLEDNEVEWLLKDLLVPLDFSGIQGYPNNYKY
jgi:hypothetical protein